MQIGPQEEFNISVAVVTDINPLHIGNRAKPNFTGNQSLMFQLSVWKRKCLRAKFWPKYASIEDYHLSCQL